MKSLTASVRRRSRMAGALALVAAAVSCAASAPNEPIPEAVTVVESPANDSLRYQSLTQADYDAVAQELGIPTAAIRAVVEIEAGPQGNGFNPDNKPIINFDLTMFTQACRRHGIHLARYKSSHAVVFRAPDRKKYGSYQAAQYARLNSAMTIDTVAALEGTFWGMFQIGGFNWKQCGCSSVQEFVELMSYSEREQLELFAQFLKQQNLVGYIRNRQWAKFALRYNGPGYKKHGYDTRMARAFAKYSRQP